MRTATSVPSLVLPATHFLANPAQWTLRVVFLLGVLLALARQAAAAPEVFTAEGNFGDGGQLAGTVTIDTGTGKLLASDLIIRFRGDEIVFTNLTQVIVQNKATRIDGTATSAPHPYVGSHIQLVLPVSTLVGFEGAEFALSTVDQRDYGESYWIHYNGSWEDGGYPLYSGSLEPD